MSRFLRIGKPFSTTVAGAVAFVISCIEQGPSVGAVFYWILYAIWATSVVCVIIFTLLSVTPDSSAEYLCLLAVTEILSLAIAVAAFASDPDEVLNRLETWAPLVTVLCAGASPLAFGSGSTEQSPTTGRGDIEGNPAVDNGDDE